MKYLFVLILIFVSCNNSKTKMHDERAVVMKIHDDAMAKMGELMNNSAKLQEIALESPDSLLIIASIKQLEDAEEAMMVWMQEYKEPEEENLTEFYANEKIRIQKVANQIDKSLENAKKYIDK